MADGGAIINFGDLSKPATVLIEKVCNAVGIIYEPTNIKRLARAEADADMIRAAARIELNELETRAVKRFVQQESRKQKNIEQIAEQAAATLPESAKVERLEEDWVAYFFKQCDTVSDKEMQSLWARLLSGEATNPGTFSKRTVDFISTIDKKDAALFTSFCQFVWMIGDLTPLIYDQNAEIFKKHGLTFDSLKHLDSIGLISFEPMSGYIKSGFIKYCHVFYYGRPTLIEFANDDKNKLSTGHAMLTATGKELVEICGATRNQEFYQYVIDHWTQQGLILSSIANQP